MLIDSNIIIYATLPEHGLLRQMIQNHTPYVSAISYVEVLGYHQLTPAESDIFETFFQTSPLLSITTPIIEEAVKLRQLKKLFLGDSIIAATALVHGLKLVTRNKKDFTWIPSLFVVDPLTDPI